MTVPDDPLTPAAPGAAPGLADLVATTLNELGEKIFLDRYALKDMTKQSLAVGDVVVVCVDLKTGQREIGRVKAMGGGNVTVQLRDGTILERAVENIDKPLELHPEQMMDRVAQGIARIEGRKSEEWTKNFRWLLDGWKFIPGGLEKINHIMRDHYNGDLHPIDPRLVDVLAKLQKRCGCSEPLNILSGYRSPSTNAMLRKVSHNVARNSFHMKGQAADIRVPGSSVGQVRQVAMSLNAGGVGYYPRAAFVHVDTGDVRHWTA